MAAQAHLRETIPPWARITFEFGRTDFRITARPELAGGIDGEEFDLLVRGTAEGVTVEESANNRRLPRACPERHINPNGTFCIGLGLGRQLADQDEALRWWASLGEYLVCQQAAEKFGRWPPGKWLSHDDAAEMHLALEQLGQELGWEDEVQNAIEFRQAWLAGNLPRARGDSGKLVNQRAPCPRGCKRGKVPILRRECAHRDSVFRLIELERERRRREWAFVERFRRAGLVCCGTMIDCPFRRKAC